MVIVEGINKNIEIFGTTEIEIERRRIRWHKVMIVRMRTSSWRPDLNNISDWAKYKMTSQ